MTPAIASACQTIRINAGTAQGTNWRMRVCWTLLIALPRHPCRPRFGAWQLGVGHDLPAKGITRPRRSIGGALPLHSQPGEDEFGEAVGLFQMRIATHDEGV